AGDVRRRGLSLDAVAGEVTYAIGPLVAALVAAAAGPLVSLLTAAAGVAVATVVFVTGPLSRVRSGTRPLDPSGRRERGRSPLRSPGFIPVMIAMTAPGMVLGVMDIAAPAIGAVERSTTLAGVLLALFA
ncbi:hypothetical protein SB767_28685, partial [Bacillus sp. SIMBA_069]